MGKGKRKNVRRWGGWDEEGTEGRRRGWREEDRRRRGAGDKDRRRRREWER